MLLFVQTVSALAGLAITTLLLVDLNPPWMVYAGAAFLSGWGGTWLYARWKVGRGVTVHPSWPEQPPRE